MYGRLGKRIDKGGMEVKEEMGEVADLSLHPLSCAVSVSELFGVS